MPDRDDENVPEGVKGGAVKASGRENGTEVSGREMPDHDDESVHQRKAKKQ